VSLVKCYRKPNIQHWKVNTSSGKGFYFLFVLMSHTKSISH